MAGALSRMRELTPLHVLMCVTFLVSGLCVNLVQFLLYLLLARINRRLFRSLNYYLVYIIYSQVLFLADWWSQARLNIFCHPDLLKNMGREHSLIIMDHHYELDWLYGWMVGDRCQLLGNCRVYVKKMLQYVPIIGWAWKLSDVVFLERNWEKDKDNLARKLNQLLDYPSPVWILLCPEGTRFSPEKHAASCEFAASRGLPQLQHHLLPRTKGFSFTVSKLDPTKIAAVYDVTLVAGRGSSAPPTLTSALCGRETEANMYIRKFALEDIPKDEEGSAGWLLQLFQEKDRLKESFIQTGDWAQQSGLPSQPCHSIERRCCSLVVMGVLNSLVNIPLLYLLVTGGFTTRLVLAVVYSLSWLAMRKLVNITKISKSSEYGKKKE